MQKGLNRLIIFSVAFALGVVMLGAYTRLKDAGLGCPDWPGCYGQIVAPTSSENIAIANKLYPDTPVESGKAHIEMTHRYVASTLGLFIVGILLFRLRLTIHRVPTWLPFALLGLVIFQGMLGMWTVTLKLLPIVVMGHLLGGFATLSLLWLACLYAKSNPLTLGQYAPKRLAMVTLALVFCQIFLGGWTSANYAAIVCPDFPLCQGHAWPPALMDALNLTSGWGSQNPSTFMHNEARVSVQLLHRYGAIICTFFIGWLIFSLGRYARIHQEPRTLTIVKRLKIALMAILTLQLTLGVSNIVFLAPLPVAVLHNAFGALLLLALVAINYYLPKKSYE
jgi:cytochrome c oxidase assembly protein subunit 15